MTTLANVNTDTSQGINAAGSLRSLPAQQNELDPARANPSQYRQGSDAPRPSADVPNRFTSPSAQPSSTPTGQVIDGGWWGRRHGSAAHRSAATRAMASAGSVWRRSCFVAVIRLEEGVASPGVLPRMPDGLDMLCRSLGPRRLPCCRGQVSTRWRASPASRGAIAGACGRFAE